MLRNILRLDSLFSPFGRNRGRTGVSDAVVFAPIERKTRGIIPEKRSQEAYLGDLQSDRLAQVVAQGSSSGAHVNAGSAKTVSAVFACCRLLADMQAKLPIYLYRNTPKGPIAIEDHPAIHLISSNPSSLHTPYELRHLMEFGKGLGGNGYARIFRKAKKPVRLQWIKPSDVTPELIGTNNEEQFVRYRVLGVSGLLTRFDILHVRGTSDDGFHGVSPITLLRQSIGTAISQTSAAGTLMRNGARFPGILSSETIHKKETIDEARAEWERNTTGANLNRTPILNGSFKFQQTNGMSMVDAQFLESRRFELQEIARHYGIPPFMIGDSTASTTWGTGIQEQYLGFLNNTLEPHLVGWEQSLAKSLLTDEEVLQGYYFRYDREQLKSADLAAKAQYFQTMRTIGVYSPNDIRTRIDEPLIPPEDGGNSYSNPNIAPASAPMKPETKPAPETV